MNTTAGHFSGGLTSTFYNLDRVTFDDSAASPLGTGVGRISGGTLELLNSNSLGSAHVNSGSATAHFALGTTFAGSIQTGGDLSGVQIVKLGAGRLPLSGTSAYVDGLAVETGRLVLSGSLACTGQTTVEPAGTLELSGGSLLAEALNLSPGALLTGHGTVQGDVGNRGTITASGPGALTLTGDVVNDGVIRLIAGAELVAPGAFVNNGVLDLLTAGGALPPNLVNNGVVLDASSAHLSSWERAGTAFTLRIPSYSEHDYVLQTTADLASVWTDVETRPGGTGTELVFTHDAGPAPRRFYRIEIR